MLAGSRKNLVTILGGSTGILTIVRILVGSCIEPVTIVGRSGEILDSEDAGRVL